MSFEKILQEYLDLDVEMFMEKIPKFSSLLILRQNYQNIFCGKIFSIRS